MTTYRIEIILVLVFLLVGCFLTCHSLEEVCIVPDNGNLKSPSFCNTTTTINSFCQEARSNISYAVVTVLSGTHTLNGTCKLNQVNNITLRGQSVSKVLIQCKDSGFLFWNVSMLRISNIEFIGCGAYAQDHCNFALSFIYGSDLTLNNVRVSNSKSGGMYIKNVVGKITVSNCKFVNATADDPDNFGGNRVLYTPSVTTYTYLTITNSIISGFGYDGIAQHLSGLVFHLESLKIIINIDNTTFMQSRGNLGGNMAILFYSFASVTISNTIFNGGHAPNGGGLYVAFEKSIRDDKYESVSYKHSPEVLRIINSTFTKNTAEHYGGGIYIIWWQSTFLNRTAYVDITSTIFSGNCAHGIGFAQQCCPLQCC